MNRDASDQMIVVVDCGMGNLQSVVRGLSKAGGTPVVSSKTDDVAAAERLVLPGVGSFGRGMENLSRGGLLSVLTEKVLHDKTPLLGICVGHQMLTSFSAEGDVAGLGWIEGQTSLLPSESDQYRIKIPHMGWNTLRRHNDSPLLRGIADDACFYFAHSYAVTCDQQATVVAETEYGRLFASIVQKENIFGVQFHPEKSHANGIAILKNFLAVPRQPAGCQAAK